MDFELKIDAVSIVFRGSFTPDLFHPGWFTANGLMSADLLSNFKIEIVSPDLAVFFSEWLRFEIQRDRFALLASQTSASSEQLRDLAIGTLTIQEDAKIRAIGLNRDMHFIFSSKEKYKAVGDTYAPKDIWKKLGMENLGLRSLLMESKRDNPLGHVWVRLEVSEMFGKEPSIRIDVNNHYENAGNTAGDAILILGEHWKPDLERSLAVAEELLKLG